MTLAVYHASPDVEAHLAALRRAGRFRLTCVPQRRSLGRLPATRFDGVLWELAPGTRPDRRRLTEISRRMPVVSYSVETGRDVTDFSRSIGFASHLTAPLNPVEVEHRLAMVAPGDLATRVSQVQQTFRRQMQRVDGVAEMVRSLNETLDPPRVAQALVARSAEWIPAPAWAVLVSELSGEPRVLAGRGLAPPADEAVALQIGEWIIGHGRDFHTGSIADDGRIENGPSVAALGFPLACRDRTIGALVALDRTASGAEPALAPAARQAFGLIVEAAAIALDNAMRVQRVEALSVTDDLTQLYNSRYLSQALRRETKRTLRSGRPLALLFIDLDGFKSINDAHGHLAGSRALVEAAGVIRGSARETDMVARFGGDEFALVLPDTGPEGALAVGERIRERIAAHGFLASEGLDIHLSASVGVAVLPDSAASAEALIQAADQAMYWVKYHGKNGIHVATA